MPSRSMVTPDALQVALGGIGGDDNFLDAPVDSHLSPSPPRRPSCCSTRRGGCPSSASRALTGTEIRSLRMPFDTRRWPNAVTIGWLIAEHMGMGVSLQQMRAARGQTPEIAAEKSQRMEAGENLRSICRSKDMPDEATVRLWARENREGFYPQYARAMETRMEGLADEILEIADDRSGRWHEKNRGKVNAHMLLGCVDPYQYHRQFDPIPLLLGLFWKESNLQCPDHSCPVTG